MNKTSKSVLLLFLVISLILCLSLVACKKSEPVEIKFILNGVEHQAVTASDDGSIELPKSPSKAGQIFEGWQLADGTFLSSDYLKNTPVKEGFSVTAKFYYLNDFVYDENKLGIREDDAINAGLFSATLRDSDNQIRDIQATVVEGNQAAGETISVKLLCIGKYGLTKETIITGIKVYGAPKLNFTSKGSFKISETVDSALLSASGKDSFNVDTTVNISVKEEEYAAGDTVTLILSTKDVANNEVVSEITGVKVYGDPTIGNATNTIIKVTDEISSKLLGVVAKDSFNQELNITAEITEGNKASGETVTIRFSATDAAGNTVTKDITNVKIYGTPTLKFTSKGSFKASEEPANALLAISGKDSFNTNTTVNVAVKEENYVAGDSITLILSTTDEAGNEIVTEIEGVKVYGVPTLTHSGNKIVKEAEVITPAMFNVQAKDSFNKFLEVTTTVIGEQTAGNTITVRFSATDAAGNTVTKDINDVKVYGKPTLKFTSKGMFKSTEAPADALSGVSGKDSFGVDTTVNISVKGGEGPAGSVVTLILSTKDVANNENTIELEGIKVYGAPQITYTSKPLMKLSDKIDADLFSATAKDSFNKNIPVTTTIISGNKVAGGEISVRLSITDVAGNTITRDVNNIKVYGMPTITYDTTKTRIKETDSVDATLFNISAKDSFNVPISNALVGAYIASGTQVAGNTITVTIYAMDNAWNIKEINVDVKVDFVFKRVDKNGAPKANGEYILFGEYPQTIKASNVTIQSDTPEYNGYFLGSDGFYYAKVVAYPHGNDYTFSNGSTVVKKQVYYFKVEPIKWRILNYNTLAADGNKAFLLCEDVLDTRRWNEEYEGTQRGAHANNYEKSEMRVYLNNDFYDNTFNHFQKQLIQTTSVDNSPASTGTTPNEYACSDTSDKIFLLSIKEATTTSYGFSGDLSSHLSRQKIASDYAKAMGIFIYYASGANGNCLWYSRSPQTTKSVDIRYFTRTGSTMVESVGYDYVGIVPALKVDLG
ncbi:MAG TPA: DUF6273 domain-containing protein [Clostridia bacterium]|mgnify:CR=1 FL=1|nr:DUF6273 domain-containing protein [Clostridia bacterium]